MCLGDARMFLPGLNLAYTDRSSMAASTEVRVPYVDVEVVKAAFAVPGDRKIVGRQGKAVLKEAAASILPREIVYRPKGLFSAPLRAWMSRDLAPLVREVVNDGVLVRSGLLRRDALARHGRRGRRRAAGLLQASVACADPRVLVSRRDLRVRPERCGLTAWRQEDFG